MIPLPFFSSPFFFLFFYIFFSILYAYPHFSFISPPFFHSFTFSHLSFQSFMFTPTFLSILYTFLTIFFTSLYSFYSFCSFLHFHLPFFSFLYISLLLLTHNSSFIFIIKFFFLLVYFLLRKINFLFNFLINKTNKHVNF